jgi:long-chain acyl-CoA synthetase
VVNLTFACKKPWLKFWPANVPTKLNYPKMALPQVLEKASSEYPDKPAIIFEEASLTYNQLCDYVKMFAAALQDLDVKKGDRIAIYLPNCPQFIIAVYGAHKAGAVVVPCSSAYKEREFKHMLTDSGSKVLVTHESQLSKKLLNTPL